MQAIVKNNIGDLVLPIAMILLCAIFTIAEPTFLSADNFSGIDLSIGPVMALAGLAASAIYFGTGLPVGFAIAFGFFGGGVVGTINGIAIAVLRLPPIIMTLGMLSIVRGFALLVRGPDLHQIREEPFYTFLGNGRLGGLPISVWIFLALTVLKYLVQKRASLGLLV